ncbi:mitochondrial distribution and morphology protein 10 [Kwoniella heveanensis CBS 569]|nr:mitochondrial distribution and morphology protein 10 [Kwoniella heveanensis CBS 569]
MIGFSTFILRNYYAAIGWNEDNLYSSITRSSSALLDFQVPQSLILQLANAPTPIFFTSYALDALPQLNGSISYITTSEPLQEIGPSRTIRFKDVVERFRVFPPPKRPIAKDEVWLGGRRVEGRDYMLYSRLHLPSLHLSGLATTRLTPTLQAHLAFLSQPAPPSPTPPSAPPPPPPGNVLISLQHDTGRYSGEYTYSAQDGMFGLRGLYNFGWQPEPRYQLHTPKLRSEEGRSGGRDGKRIDEEEMMEGGLKGRFSAGGEVYFSAKQRSFGISTGLRFTTIPPVLPHSPNSPAPSPPTTLTLLYNPLIGFLSSAYSAQVSPTVALSTRFGFNVYSYESDLAIGGEWWIGRRRGKREHHSTPSTVPPVAETGSKTAKRDGPEERIAQTDDWSKATLRSIDGDAIENERLEKELDSPSPITTSKVEIKQISRASQPPSRVEPSQDVSEAVDERDGVLKARLSGNWSIALLYEARIRKCLVSVGIISDLASRQRPIRSVGVEVQYFS